MASVLAMSVGQVCDAGESRRLMGEGMAGGRRAVVGQQDRSIGSSGRSLGVACWSWAGTNSSQASVLMGEEREGRVKRTSSSYQQTRRCSITSRLAL